MMSGIELAALVFRDHAAEFWTTVSQSGPTGRPSVTCGATEGDLSLTRMHLNPYGESDCAGVDLIVLAVLIAIVHVISWLPRYIIYEPLANARMKGFKTWDDDEAKRFSQTATSLLFFCSSAVFATRILGPEEWIYSPSSWYFMSNITYVSPSFKFYTLWYISRFSSDLISIFFEKRKKDAFIASFIHHVTTISLVSASAVIGFLGFGGLMMFLFDWADIPLLAAKLFIYLSKDQNDMYQYTANRLFELFAVVFFVSRVCLFNYVVYRAVTDLPVNTTNRIMEFLMFALACLQTYWMYLIIAAVKRQKKCGGNVEDIRETDACIREKDA